MAKKTATKEVGIVQLELAQIEIPIFGVSPLIMHAWSRKAKEEMLAKQMKKAKITKAAKDPDQDVEDALYRDPEGLPCFPSVAFKASAIGASKAMDLVKTNLRQAFHIDGEMVPIFSPGYIPRQDMVRVGMGVADIRFRPEFRAWGTILPVTINTRLLSVEQLVALFDAGGFGIGVGEWRPEKDGQFGRYKVADEAEEKLIGSWVKARSKKEAA